MKQRRGSIRALWGAALLGLLVLTPPAAARELRIQYQSADFVYLDGGKSDGLAAGDTLRVVPAGSDSMKTSAVLAVEHVAEHSAACRILKATDRLQVGEIARPVRESRPQPPPGAAAPAAAAPAPAAGAPMPAAAPNPAAPGIPAVPAEAPIPLKAKPDLSGYAAFEWYHLSDRSAARLDYDQPTLRFQFKARGLLGKDLVLQARGRARHDQRRRSFAGTAPSEEWSNRVYTFSLSYDAPEAAVNWQIGRVVSNALAATGPLDGALAEARLSPLLWAGAFGGTLPDWRTTAPRGSLQKYGLFLRAVKGAYGSRRWAAALAGTAEYHGSVVSRQFAYLQSDFQSGRRWSMYQSGEVDLNNGWRMTGGAKAVALSNAYLTLAYRPASGTSLSLSYDDRRNYRTWDNRSLPDSLFDRAFRTGLRAQANVRILPLLAVYASAGGQHRQGEKTDSWSWAGGLTQEGILDRRVVLTLQAAGFRSPTADGVDPSLLIQKSFSAGHLLSLSGGAYLYRPGVTAARRTNRWTRMEGTYYLSSRFYLSGQVEHDWGTDLRGDRFLAEIGRNF